MRRFKAFATDLIARRPYTQNSTTLQSQRKNENTSLNSLLAMVAPSCRTAIPPRLGR
jgi:hypothetical protein